MKPEIANVDMAAAWDGEEGDHWVEKVDNYESSTRRHTARLFDALALEDGDHVLDIGCGTGGTTRDAARCTPHGDALGVDLSSRMLEWARERARAEGVTNVTFEQGDAQVYPFGRAVFDVAMSRFGSMFFADPVAAFRNLVRALRPGGRLGLLAWQELGKNEWLTEIRRALAMGRELPSPPVSVPGPFGLADPDHVRRVLEEAQFCDIEIAEVAEPLCLGTDAEDAFEFGYGAGPVRGLLEELDDSQRAEALDNLREMAIAHETPDGVVFDSRAWLVSAHGP